MLFLYWFQIYVCHVSSAVSKCVFRYHFVNFGRFAAQIRSYIHFSKCWIPLFSIFVIRHLITWPASYACAFASSLQFHLNWTIYSSIIAKKWFSMWCSSDTLNLWICELVTFPSPWSKFAIAYQISSNSDDLQLWYGDIFKMAAVRHVGFSKFWPFSSRNLCVSAIVLPHSKFRLNWTIWSRVIARKWFWVWRPSAILDLGISEIFSRVHRLGQNLHLHTKFCHSDDSRLRYGNITIFQHGSPPPCWIYCDVIIL